MVEHLSMFIKRNTRTAVDTAYHFSFFLSLHPSVLKWSVKDRRSWKSINTHLTSRIHQRQTRVINSTDVYIAAAHEAWHRGDGWMDGRLPNVFFQKEGERERERGIKRQKMRAGQTICVLGKVQRSAGVILHALANRFFSNLWKHLECTEICCSCVWACASL